VRFGVLNVDATSETFALVYGPKKNGNDVYEAMRDDKFKFDLNHFTAILFFEWKAVSDLKRQS
jgi:hypothetical protein